MIKASDYSGQYFLILKTLYVSLWVVNSVVDCQQVTSCDKSRRIFTSSWGIITDGPSSSNYTQDSHCEWLIRANSSEQYITLSFHTMGTECSYDYVFVYDGNSFTSPLLGSFSGKTEPQEITATTGSMLVLLYSDTNYVLGGFHAEFSVTDCPRNCTQHGMCIGHKCVCEGDWGGSDCSYELCPDKCGLTQGRGRCDSGKCVCNVGYSGQSCSLNKSETVGNSWHWLSHSGNGLKARAAHTAVYVKQTDSLYIFGGYDLNNILGDLSVYRFTISSWEDGEGNILAGSLGIHEAIDPSILKTVLKQVGAGEERWGIKPKSSFLHNALYSYSENEHRAILERQRNLQRNDSKHVRREVEVDAKEEERVDKPATENSENWEAEYTSKAEVESTTSTAQDIPIEEAIDESEDEYITVGDVVTGALPVTENIPDYPSPRFGHAACRHHDGFVIYGGKLSDGELSDELWFYNVTERSWALRALYSNIRPPKLTRHTITLVQRSANDSYLYVFGGSTLGGEFSSSIYRIKLSSDDEEWEHVRPRGGKELDVRVVAHSTVYYSRSHSLIVYGGVMAGLARFSKLSDRMLTFQINNRHWSEINYPRSLLRDSYVPRERAFHTSTIIGNYLVIYGGYSHRHKEEEICYDNQMYLYHLGCHTWVSHDVLSNVDKGNNVGKPQGVFAHAADVRNGNTLLIVGGYHGNVNSDLLAFVLPATLASREGEHYEPDQVCSRHHTLLECTSNPECGWCSADEICYGRTVGINCTTNLQTTRCPGVCLALGDCHSCLLHGEAATEPSVVHKLRLGECVWCVQNARCHHRDDNYGVCGLRDDTPSQVPGWWGTQGTEVTNVDECRTKDRRPGLTFLTYRHPMNLSQPDSVSIINATTVDFEISTKETRTEQNVSNGVITARLLGYIRTPEAWANSKEQLELCASFSQTKLKLSRDDQFVALEQVANFTPEFSGCVRATWPSGTNVILHPGRYLIDSQAKRVPLSGPAAQQQSKMEVQHSKSRDSAKVFTFEYLEPYQNGSCQLYKNCLQCLSDSLCGWCQLSQLCLPRELNETQVCRTADNEDWNYLTLQPASCANCSNYISCQSCVGSNMCEWWTEEARCSRKGRYESAVVTLSQCPKPCHLRDNCSQCLDEKGRCVWCEATNECFSFSVYTSEYQFGMCREWIDQMYYNPTYQSSTTALQPRGSEQCKSCNRHTNCSSCLHTLSCGWCYDVHNPIRGACIPGDFDKPHVESCSSVINDSVSLVVDASWSYAQCPDVNECDLKLDNCHHEAVCTNTHGSFICQCKRGFYGDGRHSCTKTCYNPCVNGECTMAPHYKCKCHLGWTGEDCSIDCGCNNHSTCNKQVGLCDECQEWTTGQFCQLCKQGSYGNATTAAGCNQCNCNQHGDEMLGVCDSVTGVCFCQHDTEGDNCHRCKKGFYGDPSKGGTCYNQCVARGMLTGTRPQGFGSRSSELSPWSLPVRECLWIITLNDFDNKTVTDDRSVIQLTIHNDINIKCLENNVYVYDGLPDFGSMASSHQSHALGTFCENKSGQSLMVESRTGILTVHYKQGEPVQGFNASYQIFTCPENCPGNRQCIDNRCVCMEGFIGVNCHLIMCPNDCHMDQKRGVCDKGYGRCICQPEFGGEDCSVRLNRSHLVLTELFNSARLADNFSHLRTMLPRFGHSLVTDRRGSLWMFGGYSPSHGPLNDIRLFDTKNNTWMQVTVDSTTDASMPQGRYFHSAEIVQARGEIYVYGGIADKGNIVGLTNNTLNDFWKFSIAHQRWMEVQAKKARPPPLAGHTLTLKKGAELELVLIGGVSPKYGFLESIWLYNIHNEAWTVLSTSGNGPVGIYGHTTVYHSHTESFYVFGGYSFISNHSTYSDRLYSLHYPTLTWSVLPSFNGYNTQQPKLPLTRFLHSAVTTNDFMFVFAGSDNLLAYSYSCSQWIDIVARGAQIVGKLPPHTYGQAMTHDPDTDMMYVMGGFDGTITSHMTRLKLPVDLCNLWIKKDPCRLLLGCSYCEVTRGHDNVSSYCYSSSTYPVDLCEARNSTLLTNNGVKCDSKWFQLRTCEQFTTCDECLAQWPIHIQAKQMCKWCSSRCVSNIHNCTRGVVTDVQECPGHSCSASDCDKCEVLDGCTWSRQAGSDWHCSKGSGSGRCPSRCGDLKDCTSCLLASGGEGGWHECRWSTSLRECISPNYQPLYCSGGVCGAVLKGANIDQCPEPCSSFKQCSVCLSHAHCGWCGLEEGEGLCTEGSMDKSVERPALDTCEALLNESATWHYVTCPPENECVNSHHTCNNISEECVDLLHGFECVCGRGYKLFDDDTCQPVCKQGCVRGACVEPDNCRCDFGYVGSNCSIQCQCNGHSNCAGPDRLSECTQCHNNTMGAQCDRCKPLFVGNPTSHGQCVPCLDYCHGHTHVCINETQPHPFPNELLVNLSVTQLEKQLVEGPLNNARCVGCSNRTTGDRCEECLDGNFRGTEDHRDVCRPCECHGHGDTCNPVTGEKCNCQNNTESDTSCQSNLSKNSNQQCWMLQCSKCKETFSGTPTDGHQCYRQMTLDHKFCLDSKLIDECNGKPTPLHPGQSVFFQVQPRYVNVDIRVILDVTQGCLDLYMSPRDDTLVVNSSHPGIHVVEWDPKFRKRSTVQHSTSRVRMTSMDVGGNSTSQGDVYVAQQQEADGIATYVTITKRNMFLHVRNVRDRLVLTLPKDTYDLVSTRFYLALVASHESTSPSYGMIFFRQDQLHIDLFVFFSVFFSCFFLFLAACVVAWKAKQTADLRRARRRHVVEMLTMAKRPFAAVTILLDSDNNESQSPHRKKRRLVTNDVRPVAIEPTDDGFAAVGTVFVKLPGGSEAPVRLALASSLVTISRACPANSRAFLRRRSSHHAPPT